MKYISAEESARLDVEFIKYPIVPPERVAVWTIYLVEPCGLNNGKDAVMTYDEIETYFAAWDQSGEDVHFDSAYDWFIERLWDIVFPLTVEEAKKYGAKAV